MILAPERLPSVMLVAIPPRSPPPPVVQQAILRIEEQRRENAVQKEQQMQKQVVISTQRQEQRQPQPSPDLVDYDLFAEELEEEEVLEHSEDVFNSSNDPVAEEDNSVEK